MNGHPGTLWLGFFALMGGGAGGWLGAGIMLAVFAPLWLIGAWERGNL